MVRLMEGAAEKLREALEQTNAGGKFLRIFVEGFG